MAMYMKLPKKQIVEMLINCNDVITALTQSKNCVIPAVVGLSEQLICPCCGSDKTYKTDAIHCNRCAVTTEI